MNIRECNIDDIAYLLPMAGRFFGTTPMVNHIELDAESISCSIKSFLSNDSCKILIAEDLDNIIGVIGASISPCIFNLEVNIASELFWYVHPEYRSTGAGSELRRSAEEWAKSKGATIMIMVAIEGPKCNAVRKIYERSGYTNTEHIYLKEI